MSKERLSFVTGANDKYFFMCSILLQSLEKYFPEISCFVMDFGLTDSQTKFFETKKQLLKVPPHLKKTDHFFKLKSSVGSFLKDQSIGIPIWVDSDIIAVAPESNQLFEIADRLSCQREQIAIGVNFGVRSKITNIREHLEDGPTPKLRATVADSPEILESPYLNSGLVFFSDFKVFEDWENTASLLEGDWLWEQNALNLICYRNRSRVLTLDSRVWNVHCELLKKITIDDNRVYCDGQKSIFAHATTPTPGTGDVDYVRMTISKNGYACNTYLRLFTNSFLRMAQDKHLSDFLSANFVLLKDLNVLFKQGTRRNESCPCGSGKAFKHCHGTHL
jgi:hypothetical protein